MDKCILIDGSGLIYRGFYAIPPFFRSPDGTQTNAVFGFTTILLGLITKQKPDFIAVAFDKKGPTFRHEAFKEYKATRIKAPQELYDQIPLVKKVVSTLKIPSFEVAGFEADDILATIVRDLNGKKDLHTYIATGDFDLCQLVQPGVSILSPAKGFKEAEILHVADVEKKYSIMPNQISDYKGLAGDSSDNIPGVMGIGDKGAVNLLHKYGNLENIYEHIDDIKGSLQQKLIAGKESAFMSKDLATLRDNVPLNFDLESCRVHGFDVASARQIFDELGFKSLHKKLDEIYGSESKQVSLFG